ncbi:hypothetical protein [Kitasatospora sp. NPDC089509]|uniref:hypothetical protein n=1 Tax=Kitasatospora sp. NPDC089509 TaxID=3364079 RepID=UPI00381E077E
MARREGRIEALLAGDAGLLTALATRWLLYGPYSDHAGHYLRLKLLDATVLLTGMAVAVVSYRVLRHHQRRDER